MKNWKVNTRIALGFATVIGLTILLGTLVFSRMPIIEHNANELAKNNVPSVIQDSLDKMEKGTELVSPSGATSQDIVGSVKRVTDLVEERAVASGEQSKVDQVNTPITQLDHVTQPNSTQTKTLAATAQGLATEAAGLLHLVGSFHLVSQSEHAHSGRSHQVPQSHRPPTPIVSRPAVRSASKEGSHRGASLPSGRKQVAQAPALVGSGASRSDNSSFEEC
jgi:hypothetical protein